MKNQKGLQGARRLLRLQMLLTVVFSLIFQWFFGGQSGLSALLGGLVSVLPNAYFAKKLFQHHGAQASQKIVRAFYLGEAVKLGLTAALFVLVFSWVQVAPVVFFVAFIAVQSVLWFAPLIFVDESTNRSIK